MFLIEDLQEAFNFSFFCVYFVRFVLVIIMPGVKSDYATEYSRQEDRQNFITVVEYSPQYPHGKAVAPFNFEIRVSRVTMPCFSKVYLRHTH